MPKPLTDQERQAAIEQARNDLATVQARETEFLKAEEAKRDAALLAYAKDRATTYNRAQLDADVRDAWQRVDRELAATPWGAALVDAIAAEARRNRAGHANASDVNTIAVAAGYRPTAAFEDRQPTFMSAELISNSLARTAANIIADEADAENQHYWDATAGNLTIEEVQAIDERRAFASRQAEHRRHSVDVSGLTGEQIQQVRDGILSASDVDKIREAQNR